MDELRVTTMLLTISKTLKQGGSNPHYSPPDASVLAQRQIIHLTT
jgi:hypothetical protein